MLDESPRVRHLEWAYPQRQKVERQMPAAGGGGGASVFNGDRVSVLQDGQHFRDAWMVVMVAQPCECPYATDH